MRIAKGLRRGSQGGEARAGMLLNQPISLSSISMRCPPNHLGMHRE